MRTCLIGMAILLSSCGSAFERSDAGSTEPAAGASPAKSVESSSDADAASLRAGAWASEASLVSVDSPDIAPEDVDRLRADLTAEYSGHDSCLAPHEIHRPPQQFFSGAASGCDYERLRLADGEISGVMNCRPLPADGTGGQDPSLHRIEFTGSYTADSYSLEARHVAENEDRSRRVSFILSTQARRVGGC
jgi:hypothetical protein